jgi:hypothetical protein
VRSSLQPGRSLQGTATQRAPGVVGRPAGLEIAPVVGARGSTGAGGGGAAQPANKAIVPRMGAQGMRHGRGDDRFRGMWLLLLEALGAGLILVFIVWWTMFSGRSKGERKSRDDSSSD